MITPVKYFVTSDGALFIYDSIKPVTNDQVDIKLDPAGNLWIAVEEEYLVPVEALEISPDCAKKKVYIAGSIPPDPKTALLGVITLDGVMIGKILTYIELAEKAKVEGKVA